MTAARSMDEPAAGRAGLYGPASEAWRLNRESIVLLGAGPRALLLQIAHPAIAEGVDQHSAFRADPWGRLQGTLRSILRIVYGTGSVARAEIRRLNALHRSIRGPIRDPEGRAATGATAYAARDPALALWVHATIVDSTMAVHHAWIEPLSADRRAAFYGETRPIGRAFGIPDSDLPPDVHAFDAYVAAMLGPAGPVHVTATARTLAATIVHPPLAPLVPALAPILAAVPAAAYDWTLWPAIGLLPPSVRDGYAFRWTSFERLVAAWLTASWRAWRPLLPPAWRWMPQAMAADRRVREAEAAG